MRVVKSRDRMYQTVWLWVYEILSKNKTKNLLKLLFILFLVLSSYNCYRNSNNCRKTYLKYSPNHTACKPAKKDCLIIKVSHTSFILIMNEKRVTVRGQSLRHRDNTRGTQSAPKRHRQRK